MKPFPLDVKRFRYHDGRRLCQSCLDAIAAHARATGAAVHASGRVELDGDHPETTTLWRKIAACKEPAAGTNPPAPNGLKTSLKWLCPHRVTEWTAARGDQRWEILNGLRAKPAARGWWIDLADERVKAFLAEEGEAAKLLLSGCP